MLYAPAAAAPAPTDVAQWKSMATKYHCQGNNKNFLQLIYDRNPTLPSPSFLDNRVTSFSLKYHFCLELISFGRRLLRFPVGASHFGIFFTAILFGFLSLFGFFVKLFRFPLKLIGCSFDFIDFSRA